MYYSSEARVQRSITWNSRLHKSLLFIVTIGGFVITIHSNKILGIVITIYTNKMGV